MQFLFEVVNPYNFFDVLICFLECSIRSGLLDARRLLDKGIKVGLGTGQLRNYYNTCSVLMLLIIKLLTTLHGL